MIKLKCPICGGTSFLEGTVSEGFPVHFTSKGSFIWAKKDRIEARACQTCGNIQMFIPVGEPETFSDV